VKVRFIKFTGGAVHRNSWLCQVSEHCCTVLLSAVVGAVSVSVSLMFKLCNNTVYNKEPLVRVVMIVSTIMCTVPVRCCRCS
jgi:hypothetical protein